MSTKKFTIFGQTTISWTKEVEFNELIDAEEKANELSTWSWPHLSDTVVLDETNISTDITDIAEL